MKVIALNLEKKMNEKEQIIQDIFKNTNLKITEDDPLVEAVIGFHQVLENSKEEFKEWAAIFTSRFEDDLTDLTLKNNTKLQILEHELTDVSKEICEELRKIVNFSLTSFDEKTKDLNMVLAKIQANYDKDSDDRFAKYFAQINEKHAQMLATQAKNNAFSQRELLFGIGGLVIGVVVCLLAFFVVR